MLPPSALPENAGLAFVGQRVPPAFVVGGPVARRLLRASNPHGKPNADVLRPLVGPRGRWAIDVAPEFAAAEAALYAAPFRRLQRAVRAPRGRWWTLPRPNSDLRAALARHDRFLVTPMGNAPPAFVWIDAPALPDDSLLVVTRDDDFAHGLLQSRVFAVWWRRFHRARVSARVLLSFPFPWRPATPLGRLTALQEEQRHAVARAARSGNPEGIDAAAAAAYGWPADQPEPELLNRLLELNHHRQESTQIRRFVTEFREKRHERTER